MYESMISSLLRWPSGASMATSQCSKSRQSTIIVSFGGRVDKLRLGSFCEDEVACVDRSLGGNIPVETILEENPATSGRERCSNEDADRELVRGDDEEKERAKIAEMDFAGRRMMEREIDCVAIGSYSRGLAKCKTLKLEIQRLFNLQRIL